MTILAVGVNFSPLMFAALAAWILCTTLHEFSHALVAYWGGDDTVRGKGYLSLDPTRFIDPVFSLLIPAIVLLMGGFPLPGAAVMIDYGRLRNERWGAYVSAAGPASNLILFLLFCVPIHPLIGIVDPDAPFQPTWVNFVGAMAVLNFLALLFNLIPVPPLDGFGIVEHRLDYEVRWKLRQPAVAMGCVAVLFVLLWNVPGAWTPFFWMLEHMCDTLGLPFKVLVRGYSVVMFDRDV